MKTSSLLPALALFFAGVLTVSAQENSEVSQPPSGPPGHNQRAEVSQWIGLVKVTIGYHSPSLRGPRGEDRTGHIWGEVVHYGFVDEGFGPTKAAPWRAGADESTRVTFSHDVKIEGHDLKAGTYALFLDVEKDRPWTWIFSRHLGWGSYQYDPKDEVLRVPATPLPAARTEDLTYGFDDRTGDSAVAYLQWEEKRVPFKIDVPNANELYVAQMRQDLQGWAGFNYQNWQQAAAFCVNNKINLEEALEWADKAITWTFRGATPGHRDFSTLQTKASVLEALGRQPEADTVMAEALKLQDTDMFTLFGYFNGLLRAGKMDKALEVAKLNQQHHTDELFWTHFALARVYTAVGDKPHAIAEWELALKSVPPSRKNAIPQFEATLKKLKEGS